MVQVIKKILHLQERRLISDLKIKSFVSYSLFLCLLHIVSFYFSVLSCQPFSCVRHPGVVHTETRVSDVPRPGCRAYRDPDVRHAETRVSDMSRPGCHAMPFRISVFSFRLPLFLFARMRIYYNVSLFPDFPSSLKKYVLQHICQSAFYKNVQEKLEKIP